MRPGASYEELQAACRDDLDGVLRNLGELLGPLGLEIVVIDESDKILGGGRRRVLVRSKEPLRSQDLKLCGWDRRMLAALAVVACFITNRGGRAKEMEIVNLLKAKGVSSRKIDRLVEAGYLDRDGEMIRLGWRALAEIDQDQLRRLFIASKPAGGGGAD
jgi:hypothetical protein